MGLCGLLKVPQSLCETPTPVSDYSFSLKWSATDHMLAVSVVGSCLSLMFDFNHRL